MNATTASFPEPRFSNYLARLSGGAIGGIAMTALLFWTMQAMVEMSEQDLNEQAAFSFVDFVRLKREEAEPPRRELEKAQPPEKQPDPPKIADFAESAEATSSFHVPLPGKDSEHVINDDFGFGVGEGDYLPIVKVAPVYPQRALSRGTQGFCVVQFTVTATGTTRDPVVIEDQCTSTMFHRVSLEAVLKFRYKPRVISGVPVEVPGVQNKFTYQIDD